MKKVHLITCLSVWAIWAVGIILLLVNVLLCLIIGNYAAFFSSAIIPYLWITMFVSLIIIPVEPIMFIITLIIETLEWTKKSLLTVVAPFLATVVLWFVYIFAFVGLTGGV
ncbi:MAG: hypothetical protein UD936_07225 [Acutalibacteraceae bacterium]|nr:hypothetical protein [Acutalibacteraceae bacterium]